MGIKKSIKQAISQRSLVSFKYKGYARTAEPYHYGKLLKNPNNIPIHPAKPDQFLCFQISGFSKSGKMGYKAMDLHLLKNLQIIEKIHFKVRSAYNPNDQRWEIEYGVGQ